MPLVVPLTPATSLLLCARSDRKEETSDRSDGKEEPLTSVMSTLATCLKHDMGGSNVCRWGSPSHQPPTCCLHKEGVLCSVSSLPALSLLAMPASLPLLTLFHYFVEGHPCFLSKCAARKLADSCSVAALTVKGCFMAHASTCGCMTTSHTAKQVRPMVSGPRRGYRACPRISSRSRCQDDQGVTVHRQLRHHLVITLLRRHMCQSLNLFVQVLDQQQGTQASQTIQRKPPCGS